jgi:DNA-binding CsgD family transcriptional regulator
MGVSIDTQTQNRAMSLWWSGLDYEQIAKRLGISATTVRKYTVRKLIDEIGRNPNDWKHLPSHIQYALGRYVHNHSVRVRWRKMTDMMRRSIYREIHERRASGDTMNATRDKVNVSWKLYRRAMEMSEDDFVKASYREGKPPKQKNVGTSGSSVSSRRLACIDRVRLLKKQGCRSVEIIEITGLAPSTVYKYLKMPSNEVEQLRAEVERLTVRKTT